MDEMYRGEFDIGGCGIALNIEDTGGNYAEEFRSDLLIYQIQFFFKVSNPDSNGFLLPGSEST